MKLKYTYKNRQELHAEYEVYVHCSGNGSGVNVYTGKPLLTFDEWLNE